MPETRDNRIATVSAEIAKIINTVRGREHQVIAIASAATQGQWTKHEVKHGFDAVKSQFKLKENSVGTLANQINCACDPCVRVHAGALAKLAREVWEFEGLAGPCHKAFKRPYHLIFAMFTKVLEDGQVLQNASEVAAFAVARDPDLDDTKVLRRLQDIRELWQAFAKDFPVPGADKVDQYFGAIRTRHLKAALQMRNQPRSATSQKTLSLGFKAPGTSAV
jgi:hypothetical protein